MTLKSLLVGDRSRKLKWHAQGARDAYRIFADVVLAPPFPLTPEGIRDYCFMKATQDDPLFRKMEMTQIEMKKQGKTWKDYVEEKLTAAEPK